MFNKTLQNVVNEGDKIKHVSKTKVNAVPDFGFQLMKNRIHLQRGWCCLECRSRVWELI